jgi:ATP-dependent Lhr-like helicase
MGIVNWASARQAFPRSLGAFLGRFGGLTPVQAAAFPVVASGRDCVVVAAAASGKTEAALVPLCERLVTHRDGAGIRLLYLVPTRALANDLELRGRGPVETLSLTFGVRTGERPTLPADGGPDVLVTTPESLDSMLCRKPERFGDLAAVVLDEAHLLDGNYRGDQVRILIRRLNRWHCRRRPQLLAMSATIGDPAGLGARFFGTEPAVVRAGGERPVTVRIEEDLDRAVRHMRQAGLIKVIAFCNSRALVEDTARRLASGPWPASRIVVHHASLSRREREDVEEAFHRWEAGILVATTTMELGIDIGDVDAVLLVEPPLDVASFRQRVGRGCRRRAGMTAVCVPLAPVQRGVFEAQARAVAAGEHPEDPYVPDLSVLVQQTFSVLYGRSFGVPRRELVDLISVVGGPPFAERVIDHLLSEGHVEVRSAGRLVLSSAIMDLGQRGRIHSNIADEKAIRIVDDATGRAIGAVGAASPDGVVTLGGRSWKVRAGDRRDGMGVERAAAGEEALAPFHPHRDVGAFRKYLPPELLK